MGWLIFGTVAGACLAFVVWLVLRAGPASSDYPAEHGDGEER